MGNMDAAGKWPRREYGMTGTRGMFRAMRAGLTAAAILTSSLHAQTCPEPKAADFKVNTLLSTGMYFPVHIAVAPDGRVFIAEMKTGEIKLYKPGATAPVIAGKIATRFDNEDGLLGIALHPRFAQNGYLFAIYTTPDAVNRAHSVSRFKVNGDVVDIATGAELFRIPRIAQGRYHAGGGMAWDADENLVIGTGDDTNPHDAPNDGFGAIFYKDPGKDAQKSASNTNDLRGKVLRVHPVDAAMDGKLYTIPKGNLFAEGVARTRPEIYAMGCRNPYRVAVHPVTGWIFWGDVGPDAMSAVANRGRQGHDELNVAAAPGFFGWPYCNGNQFAYNAVDYRADLDYTQVPGVPGASFSCAAPVNNSPNNTGLNSLPPAQAPMIWYAGTNTTDWKEMGQGGETAMAGAVYKYDRANPSKTKFPPEYDGRLFFWDWTRQVYKLVTLDEKARYKSMVPFPNATSSLFGSLISAQYGADGSLYILRYSKSGYGDQGSSAALFRVDYTGAINEACQPVSLARSRDGSAPARMASGVPGLMVFELPEGALGVKVFDLSGRMVWTQRRDGRPGRLRLEMPSRLAAGVVRARFF